MKLLLTSNGFVTPEIIAKCEELAGKPRQAINFAVINEAYAVEHDDHRWVIDDLVRIKDNFGGRIEMVNLLANDQAVVRSRIAECDVIFVIGGHTDYLKSVYDKTGFSAMLPKFLESKVYVGVSAGSMVLGRRISAEAYRVIYGEADEYGITDYLGLVDFSVMPHLNSPEFPNRKESLLKAVQYHDKLVYGLTDDSVVVVDGGDVTVIGNGSITILEGKVL